MKNILKFGLTAIAVMFLFSAVAVPETKSQNLVGDILKRMDNHYNALKSLRANIKREKYNSQLDETDKYEGKITLLPGKGRNFSFRLDWTKPTKEAISVVNGQYLAYKESTKTAYTGSSGDKTVNDKGGNVLRIFSMSKEEIKTNYEVQYIGEEKVGGTSTWHLKLLPRAKTSYKFAELWVDGNGMPLMGQITLSNDDTDKAFLSGLEKNIKLKAAIFKIDLPKGTNVIQG
jgi:outer membrane lipoprotein-sorting protein